EIGSDGLVRQDFLTGQPLFFVGEDRPLRVLVHEVIRRERGSPALGLVVHRGDADLFRQIAPAAPPELVDARLEAAAGVEDVIDDQQLVLCRETRYEVIRRVHPDGLVLSIDAAVRGGTDGDVVGVNRVVFENLLYRDADRGAAAPYGDQERRAHAACDHSPCKLQGVPEQLVGGNEQLFHERIVSRIVGPYRPTEMGRV